MTEPLNIEEIELLWTPANLPWPTRNNTALEAAPEHVAALLAEVKRLRAENATYERFAEDLSQTRERADRDYEEHQQAMHDLFARYQRRCAELDAEKAKVADLLAGKELPTYEQLRARIAELEFAVSRSDDKGLRQSLVPSLEVHAEVKRLKSEVSAALGPFGAAFDLLAPSAAVHVLGKLRDAERGVVLERKRVADELHALSERWLHEDSDGLSCQVQVEAFADKLRAPPEKTT